MHFTTLAGDFRISGFILLVTVMRTHLVPFFMPSQSALMTASSTFLLQRIILELSLLSEQSLLPRPFLFMSVVSRVNTESTRTH
jgi:hypothetical protein